MTSQPKVHVFYASAFRGGGQPETCYRICSHWPQQGLDVQIYAQARWIAKDKSNAAIVPPCDAGALAAAMTELHASQEQRLSYGAQARADAAYYAWDKVADRRREALLGLPAKR